MTREYFESRAFSPIAVVAALSVVALVASAGWKMNEYMRPEAPTIAENKGPEVVIPDLSRTDWQAPPPPGAIALADVSESPQIDKAGTPDVDGLSNIAANVVNTMLNSYESLQEAGTFSEETGEKIGQRIAENLTAHVSYDQLSENDIKISEDTSYASMLKYRASLRTALEPLLENDEVELVTFARYMDTGDTEHLATLRESAANYREAAARAAKITAPKDAVLYHLTALNSLIAFAATIDALAANADDPFAGAALLRTYDAGERNVLTSFDALAAYYRTKQQS